MQKNIKVIALFLTLIFVFCGCDTQNTSNEKYMAELAEYENEIVKNTSKLWHPDIEQLKMVEEDKSLLKEKEEYMQLFKKFCGFSLPEYFIIPKATDEFDWTSVDISDRYMSVRTYMIIKKSDALEILEYLRNDNGWEAFGGKSQQHILTQKARETCFSFGKLRMYDETLGGKGALMDFIYDEENDFYILFMYVTVERDPSPGTSWPIEMYF